MSQCTYFRPAVRQITIPGGFQIMRIPACRCLLSEEAVSRLRTLASGRELADALTSTTMGDEQRPILGPDLDVIASATCLLPRHAEKCHSAFGQMMNLFDLDTTLPTEDTSC